MARNEEKQYGRLNRLWIQKQREEGRIKDVQRRPKLSTLNSVTAVRKWMPNIKDEIEYYLQQSQLSHYPERKIAEFKLHIEELEREYKRFLNKLRALDPSHKHHPWTPRAYAKRRQDAPDAPYEKRLRTLGPAVLTSQTDVGEEEQCCSASVQPPPERRANVDLPDQDQPLAFDRTKLSVVVAGCRGPLVGTQQTESLAQLLFSGLPNLHSSPLAQARAAQRLSTEETGKTEKEKTSSETKRAEDVLEKVPSETKRAEDVLEKVPSETKRAEDVLEKVPSETKRAEDVLEKVPSETKRAEDVLEKVPSETKRAEDVLEKVPSETKRAEDVLEKVPSETKRAEDVLGLGCYSSSDEDS
ncbi:uncharacterized protein si:dkey-86e18.1 [Sardina pilchardus]|uniref:uncharacterized protein si:dkey-86e18.1 n=1 Tax=Sardina pilchardus TaxID=27697 RepID=UPI002E11ED6E